MKKLIAIFAFSLMASQAYAGDSITMTSDLTSTSSKNGQSVYGAKNSGEAAAAATGILIGKTSTGVSVGAKSGAGGYALITQHKSGTRAFGTSYNSTSVFYKEATAGTAVLTVPTATDSSDFTSWSSM